MTKFIAVAGKGGVGKTTVAVNLASVLHNMGKNVILLDANTASPHIALHLGFPELTVSLHDVFEGKKRIEEAIYLHPSGLRVIPSNASKIPFYNKNRKISSIMLDLIGKSAIVIMDLPAALAEEAMSIIRAADETLIVTNMDISSRVDTPKMIRAAEEMGSFVPGIIVNKAKSGQVIREFGKRVVGIVPEDKNIQKSLSSGHPIVYSHPLSPASLEFKRIADLLS